MFKKITTLTLSAIFFIQMPSFALNWGVTQDYTKFHKTNYGMQKIISNTSIKYFMEVILPQNNKNQEQTIEQQINNTLTAEQKTAELDTLFKQAFKTWPAGVKNMIKEEDRTQEFADIIPILTKSEKPNFLVKVNNKNEADLIIIWTTKDNIYKFCTKNTNGCFIEKGHTIVLTLPEDYKAQEEKDKILSIFIHEIGHYFGLIDQYSDLADSSLEFSTFNRFEGKDSVMASYNKPILACDDVDGFINLIDLTISLEPQNNGQFSARAQKPWASFCNGKINGRGKPFKPEFYKEAKLLNKDAYVRDFCIYTFDEDGKVAKKTCVDPFDFAGQLVSYSDSDKKIIQAMKDTQNNLEFVYYYDFKKGFVAAKIIKNKEYDDIFFIYQIIKKEDSFQWFNPMQNNTNDVIFIYNDGLTSVLKTLKSNGNSTEYINFIFDKDYKLEGFLFTVKGSSDINKLKELSPFEIEMSYKRNKCSFYFYGEKDPILILNTAGQDIKDKALYWNAADIKQIEQKYNIAAKDFLNEVEAICKMKIDQLLINEGIVKAKYFKNLTSLYQTNSSAN